MHIRCPRLQLAYLRVTLRVLARRSCKLGQAQAIKTKPKEIPAFIYHSGASHQKPSCAFLTTTLRNGMLACLAFLGCVLLYAASLYVRRHVSLKQHVRQACCFRLSDAYRSQLCCALYLCNAVRHRGVLCPLDDLCRRSRVSKS